MAIRAIKKKNDKNWVKLGILGIQHVFAMFGATVLVPLLTGLSPAIALLAAGIGTWIFHLITKRKVPVFLGSSFAFITAIVTVGKMGLSEAEIAEAGGGLTGLAGYQAHLPYAMGGIIVAGALYLVLALLVKLVGIARIRSFFPPIVTGPMIVVIGLTLAPTAISSITTVAPGGSLGLNWLIAAAVVATMILVSIFAHGFFKLVPILFAIATGYVLSMILGQVDYAPFSAPQYGWLVLPPFMLPRFSWEAILVIAPVALVTFMEHIGDITTNSTVTGNNFLEDPGLHRTLIGDGLATMMAGAFGGPANTTYSENTGVMAVTKNYNPLTLRIAATIAVVLAFFGKFSAFLASIPGPVMGGISIILFGMIAAVGMRTLAEAQLDFARSRNLIIVAVMLVIGLGTGGGISIGGLSVSGLALSALLGLILNKALPDSV